MRCFWAIPMIASMTTQVFRNAWNDEILVLQIDSDAQMALCMGDGSLLLEATGVAGQRFAERYFSPQAATRDTLQAFEAALQSMQC